MTLLPEEVSPSWATYLDLANDTKPYLQFPSTDTASDVKLQLVVDMACQWVQEYLGRPIPPTTFFRRFSGWHGLNGAYLTLPYYPIISVSSVVEYWGASGAHTLTEQIPSNQGAQDVYQLKPLQGLLIRTFTGLVQRPWFPGSNNVEVTWVAGYNPIPATVRVATLELVAYWWRNTQQSSRSFTARSDYDEPEGATSALWPAVPNRVTLLLEPYVQQGMG
jgi:hypothetical protein